MGAKQNLRYHIVLVAKYRRKALLGIEDAVLAAVEATASGSAFTIERAAVEYGDHLHLVLRTTGTYSVSSMVKRIKAGTTQTLWGGHEPHLRKFYWGPHEKALEWRRSSRHNRRCFDSAGGEIPQKAGPLEVMATCELSSGETEDSAVFPLSL